MKMTYRVSLAVLWGTEVEADSPEEAVDLAVEECPYDMEVSVPPNVWNEDTGEIYDIE
jgi:hypothetical protein